MSGKQGRAATVMVLSGLLLIGVPTAMLGSSFAGEVHETYAAFQNNEITIKPPAPSVAEWPLIGAKVHAAWAAAATDLPALVQKLQPQLGNFTKFLLKLTADTAGGVLAFMGSLIIAGLMMAYGESGSLAMKRIMSRLTSPTKGASLHRLSTATIRSVATGVIGVAFIQALLLGVGFVVAGIPMAGVLAVLVLLLGIMQLPAVIISLPAIIYLWSAGDASTPMNVVFSAYLVVAGMADNVLKPMLLGRGVDVPMPVVLLGALGGMVASGMIGLFLGAVMLSVGYEIFMEWVDRGDEEAADGGAEPNPVPSEGAQAGD